MHCITWPTHFTFHRGPHRSTFYFAVGLWYHLWLQQYALGGAWVGGCRVWQLGGWRYQLVGQMGFYGIFWINENNRDKSGKIGKWWKLLEIAALQVWRTWNIPLATLAGIFKALQVPAVETRRYAPHLNPNPPITFGKNLVVPNFSNST